MTIDQTSALLCTGARVPLPEVASTLGVLGSLLDGTPADRALVLALREACVADRLPSGDVMTKLVEYGLASAPGTVDPVVREVVRAAVRGEGNDIRLTTPYVAAWDRTLSDLVISTRIVRAALPADQAEALIASASPAGGTPGASWVNRLLGQRFRGGSPPPPSLN